MITSYRDEDGRYGADNTGIAQIYGSHQIDDNRWNDTNNLQNDVSRLSAEGRNVAQGNNWQQRLQMARGMSDAPGTANAGISGARAGIANQGKWQDKLNFANEQGIGARNRALNTQSNYTQNTLNNTLGMDAAKSAIGNKFVNDKYGTSLQMEADEEGIRDLDDMRRKTNMVNLTGTVTNAIGGGISI